MRMLLLLLLLMMIKLGFPFLFLSICEAKETIALSPRRPPQKFPETRQTSPIESPSLPPEHAVSPTTQRFSRKRHEKFVTHPLGKSPAQMNMSSPGKKWPEKNLNGPTSSPPIYSHHHRHGKGKFGSSASSPSSPIFPPSYTRQGPSISPSAASPSSLAPAPVPTSLSNYFNIPIPSPKISPLASSVKKKKNLPSSPVLTLPPPPPNEECNSITCSEPLTYTPPGSQCGCVWPVQVGIRLVITIYKFFPLVSELASEIADSIRINHSQVRIIGADAATQELGETTVLINLVPEGVKFNDTTSFLIYKKFWQRKVSIKSSLFGAYEVLYVRYPGLPPSPPPGSSSITDLDDGPKPSNVIGGSAVKPFPVDVPRGRKQGLGSSLIVVIILSSFSACVICIGVIWFLLLKCKACAFQPEEAPHTLIASTEKQTGTIGSIMFGSGPGSGSISFNSGALTYTGSAKNFTLKDIERATDNFSASRILGEGGFGLVYKSIFDDGREAAVKVLKRDNHHGSREFLAEIEMLSRLHHRNLVKLLGICTEDHVHCLVYELIPNGSVESHLHGIDKETDPLDWDARMKIALGAARGLAYLHEDSNPRVIHRDFKSSNILLDYDFTPKVSDFGLARTALEEGNKHISTHVMGTFGYLAPEYAMTGHLLVKSDVYSYGVVLLELLTGKKPVDLSLPSGQENLVTWARPFLTSKEGLETIIDPKIKPQVSFDNLAKVAAIASMCVQPEVSHRPFMGEVVQALKLVCNEFDETKGFMGSRGRTSCSQEEEIVDMSNNGSNKIVGVSKSCRSLPECGVDHGGKSDALLSTADWLNASVGFGKEEDDQPFRRYSTSGPLRSGRKRQFWQRLRSLSRGSMSEHGSSSKFWSGHH